jgi:hypothetical protein
LDIGIDFPPVFTGARPPFPAWRNCLCQLPSRFGVTDRPGEIPSKWRPT